MRRTYLFTLIAVAATALCACKKSQLSAKEQNSIFIIGTWKTSLQNTKIYNLANNQLLKDSTTLFSGNNTARAWTEIFTADGNAYVITPSRSVGTTVITNDTTTYSTYSIVGTNLMLKQTIGGSQTKPILVLNQYNMGLQYSFTGQLNNTWGLNQGENYKIVQATYYIKQ